MAVDHVRRALPDVDRLPTAQPLVNAEGAWRIGRGISWLRTSISAVASFSQPGWHAGLPRRSRPPRTVDAGREWMAFHSLQRTVGLQVYCAAPSAAWERGTNENTNGLLRDYFPKQTDFSRITVHQLASVVKELNHRPRKCLAYRTPAEVFARATSVALRI